MPSINLNAPQQFVVENPYTQRPEVCPIEDWRDGWEPGGNLVADGLPVIRLRDPNGSNFALVRPHYIFNRIGQKMLRPQSDAPGLPPDQRLMMAFISPILEFESVARQIREQSKGEYVLGPPVFGEPLVSNPQDPVYER